MHVFTYGTLMFDEVWQTVIGERFATVAGTISGFRRHTIRGKVYPGIIRVIGGDTLDGLVYLDVDGQSIAKLDRFENDYYERQIIDVTCVDGIIRPAATYIVPESRRQLLSDKIWTPEEFRECGDLEHFLLRYGGFRRLAEDKEPT